MSLIIQPFFHAVSGTVSYVVSDGQAAAVIDSVLDFDAASGRTGTTSADALLAHVRTHQLTVEWILETHAHTDHLSGADYVKAQVGGRSATGERIRQIQRHFGRLFNLDADFVPDGRAFDHLLRDGETFRVGTLEFTALLVPGHTPADVAYRVGDAVFVGDTLFMPDVGTARADFPGGDARALYHSIQRVLALPDATRVFVCHDYPPQTRAPAWQTTVGAQKAENIHLKGGVTEAAFVAMRRARDATLAAPKLILPALQVNIRAGALPPAESNAVSYLKIPLNALQVGAQKGV
jgi:glyoxylase-like metal-dependent hydrolase (beta-lactamase superfamily II)